MKVSTPLLGSSDVMAANCPSRTVLDHVTSKWGVLVLIALRSETLRWGELRRRIGGVTEKMLSQTLRMLEGDGFVRRVAAPTIPPRVDYSLTGRGREVTDLLVPMVEWIEAHAEEIVDRAEAKAK